MEGYEVPVLGRMEGEFVWSKRLEDESEDVLTVGKKLRVESIVERLYKVFRN